MKDGFPWEDSHQTTGSSLKDSLGFIESLCVFLLVVPSCACVLVYKPFLSTVALDRKLCRAEREKQKANSLLHVLYLLDAWWCMHVHRIYSRLETAFFVLPPSLASCSCRSNGINHAVNAFEHRSGMDGPPGQKTSRSKVHFLLYCLLLTPYSLPTTSYFLLATCLLRLTTYYLLLTAYYFLLSTYYFLTYYFLLTTS